MKYRKLGRTGLKVSTLCLGTMTFGNQEWGSDEATAKRIMDAFVDAGGNFVDTADVYVDGVSEQITGRLIKDKRKDIILATKVAGPMGASLNDLGLSPGPENKKFCCKPPKHGFRVFGPFRQNHPATFQLAGKVPA